MSAPIRKKATFKKSQRRGLNFLSPRQLLFLFAAFVFTLSTLLAFTQEPFPTPFKAKAFLSQDWWQYPLERNAFTRLPVITSDINDVFVLPDGKNIWMVGDNGLILHSNNGGISWQQQSITPKNESAQIQTQKSSDNASWHFFSQAYAAESARETQTQSSDKAVPPNQLKSDKTNSDKKRNNSKKSDPLLKPKLDTAVTLSAVYFSDALNGWAVGDDGTILHTADGGKSWTPQSSGTSDWLQSVQFLDKGLRGWAVGGDGTILHTVDGGKSWAPQASGTSNYLNSVQFLDKGQRGWVVGSGGTILHTVDGGKSWAPQASGTSSSLNSVQFLDKGLRGWAVGTEGTILHTVNGGKSWAPQASGTSNYLRSVQFLDKGLRGWVVGGLGTILHTVDGGKSWAPQASGASSWLNSVQFLDKGLRGWAVGGGGTILHTVDGGKSWTPQASGTSSWLRSVQFLDKGLRGWAVGGGGTILHTVDGGKSWALQASGALSSLHSVQFLDKGLRGWAVGTEGTILHTVNTGNSWTPQPSGTSSNLNSVQFLDKGLRGWAVGEDGLDDTILHTTDGGDSWTPQTRGTSSPLFTSPLFSVQFLDKGLRGWAVGLNGTILHTVDGGKSWTPQASGTSNWLFSVQFLDKGRRGWAVGNEGTIVHSVDGGKSWAPQVSGTSTYLNSVQFLDKGLRGWAVGLNGTILHTVNGGKSWAPQASGTSNYLRSVQFLDKGLRGWAVGLYGTILRTTNGGKTWQNSLAPYQRYPAPWYYLSWLLIAGLLAPTLRREKAEFDETESVKDMLVSDRPLEKGDPDPLGFNAIALGLSRFIRNENTLPPLTLAITGAWGSGKSSLMNLLKADLKSYGFRPVWFNAWHYQKEEHLLAALLSNIRNQAIPPWWCYAGVVFRVRLMLMRGWRQCFPLLILLAVFVASGSFLYQQPGTVEQRLTSLTETVQAFFEASEESPSKAITVKDENAKTEHNLFIKSSFISSLLALIFVIIKGFTAFGINPTRLMSSMSTRSNAKDLSKQLSFRHQFAREFKDVTRALGDRTMVIMVDDLDRCRPESVLEVLESINFLVSSGDCYVILGMDPKRVVSCVALGFKDLSAQDAGQPGEDTEKSKQNSTEAYAISYLEKLINIEVPVPVPEPEQSEKLLGNENKDWHEPSLVQDFLSFIWQNRQRFFVIGIVLLVTIISWQFGSKLSSKQNTTENIVQSVEKTPTNKQQIPITETTKPNPEKDSKKPSEDKQIARFEPGQSAEVSGYFGLPPLIFMLIIAAWIFWLRQPKVVVKDSPEFIKALRIWHKLVVAKQATPRSVKRFMNRVRYFAMHHQPQQTQPGMLKKILNRFAAEKNNTTVDTQEYIPESILVAMTAMHHTNSEWLDNDDLFKPRTNPAVVEYAKNTAASGDKDLSHKELYESTLKHIENFEKWPPTAEQRALFRKIAAGIYVH